MNNLEMDQNTLVTGEISQPQFFDETQKEIILLLHSEQRDLVRPGAAQLTGDGGKSYPIVVQRVLDDRLIVEGVSLQQAQALKTFLQGLGPRVTTFVAEVSHPFFSPTVTRGFVEFHVHLIEQGPLYNGASAYVEDAEGRLYPVVVRSIGHIQPDLSSHPQWPAGDFQIIVDTITLEQAQTMCRLLRTTGPEENTFVATVLEAQSTSQFPYVEIEVYVLQYGILKIGEAEAINKVGESKSVVIHTIRSAPLVPGQRRLLITIEGISLAQSHDLQTLVQKR